MSGKQEYDAIVVGLGATGAIVARELTRAGMKVLGIDKGHALEQADLWRKFDELGFSVRATHSPTMDTDPIHWRDKNGEEGELAPWLLGPAINPFTLPPSQGPGGGSWHYAAWHYRQNIEDFRMRSEIIERYGKDALPEGSMIEDWPIGYHDLEPYYDRIETEIGVSGKAGNIRGEIDPEGNVFESPRRTEYPYPPVHSSALYPEFRDAARRLGWHPHPTATAIISRPSGDRLGCNNCGFCRDYSCHIGAKSSTHVTMVPDAIKTGNLDLWTGRRVQKVLVDGSGRAKGVSYVDTDTRTSGEAYAPIVVLAAFSIENTRLLLASGVNDNGWTGKGYLTHKVDWVSSLMPEVTNSFMGSAAAGGALDDFNGVNHDWTGTGVLWGGPIQLFNGDVQPIEQAGMAPADVKRHGPEYKKWLAQDMRHQFGIVALGVQFPMECNFLDLHPTARDPWGQPVVRMTHTWTDHEENWSRFVAPRLFELAKEMGATKSWYASFNFTHMTTHDTGGHMMGDDPTRSVVNRYQETHQVPGLYAVGGGSFPTQSAYNPTGTLQATAWHAADHIVKHARARALAAA